MAKRKTEFHELKFINPFSNDRFNSMVCHEWADRNNILIWRNNKAKEFITDPKQLDLLDIDELITQWDVPADARKANPQTCNVIFKELAIVLRLIDAEHYDALNNPINTLHLPGVIYSESSKRYLYQHYDISSKDTKKGIRVKVYDNEEAAYWDYIDNRESILEEAVTKALMGKLIDPKVYDQYFATHSIHVRPYEYYKKGPKNYG